MALVMKVILLVQRMGREHPHLCFLLPPVLCHREAVGLAVCYAGLPDEQNWLMVAGYLKALPPKPASVRH